MFESNIKKLDELYKKDPEYVDGSFSNFVNKMEYDIAKKEGKKVTFIDRLGFGDKVDIFYLVVISILLLLYGTYISFLANPENTFLFLFGFIFFIAGFSIAIIVKNSKGFGLVFLFSHGGSGFAVMVGSLLSGKVSEAFFTDLNGPIKLYLAIIICLVVFGILASVIYNLSDRFKINKLNKVYLYLVFVISIVLIGLIPYVPF